MAPTNIVMLGIDSLRADRMSAYGFARETTPHLSRFAAEGVLFERCYSSHIPTTASYATMLTGRDCFGTGVVALRHKGGLPQEVPTLAEILRQHGYTSSCVGFSGNPSSRGFDAYLDYPAWGSWQDRPLRKAEQLNQVALPELERLAGGDAPFFLFLRHMDPHSPYLPPPPFDSLFFGRDPCDPRKGSMAPVLDFKPFADYFRSWMPPGITDAGWVVAQYDGAVAYMDACIQVLLNRLDELGLRENTLVVINGDHGETLLEHDCYFDHHGLYECTLHVPLMMRLPERLPACRRVGGCALHRDLVPTVLDLLDLQVEHAWDGGSLLPLVRGEEARDDQEFYITECTWMRKHGWRTPEWKLIRALEPDFHFKPEVELYHLVHDPAEEENLAESQPAVVARLTERLEAWTARREKETGRTNPMLTNLNWHGTDHDGPFPTSQAAYETLHIGSARRAEVLQRGGAPD